MPGSTSKAGEQAGIFVRPVAVAGIFKPPEEPRPPALPEKRRFSALVGDLRPCSSSSSPDDFERRRQSWDARQKEVTPFGPALLRRAPRKTPSTPEVVSNGLTPSETKDAIKGASAVAKPSPNAKVESLNGCAGDASGERSKPQGDSSTRTDHSLADVKPKQNNKTFSNAPQQSAPESSGQSMSDVTPTSGNAIQSKKVYGLVKRESKGDIVTPADVVTPPVSNTSVSTANSSSDVLKNKTKVYGLNKPNLKQEVDLKNTNAAPSQVVRVKSSEDIKPVASKQEPDKRAEVPEKINVSHQKAESPPKNFRTVRRTSDVIAAKIQNIFSNVTPPPVSPKKLTKEVGKGLEVSSMSQPSKLTNQSTYSDIGQKKIPVVDGKNSSENVGKLEANVSSSEVRPNSQKCSKISADELKKENKMTREENVDPQSAGSRGIKTDSTLRKADSKSEKPINAALDKTDSPIEGKVPIKKVDLNSSEGTLPSLKATNQNSDRKSSNPSTSANSVPESNNKESPIDVKKESGREKLSTELPNLVKQSKPIKISHESLKTADKNNDNKSASEEVTVTKSVSQSTQVVSVSSKPGLSQPLNKAVSGSSDVNTKVEITKITQTTAPGIVPTVNVLFRTKSPQGAAVKEENRKKVLVETHSNTASVSAAVIGGSTSQETIISQKGDAPTFSAAESVKETLKTVEGVQQSLNCSPKVPAKHAIANLKKQEIASVNLLHNGTTKEKVVESAAKGKELKLGDSVCTPSRDLGDNLVTKSASSADLLNGNEKGIYSSSSSISDSSSDTKMTVVDLGDWNRRFQRVEPEPPRVPLRRRAFRDSMPPLSTPSRYGSLRRIEDATPRYIPRSPSLPPQRYSYTEMLSKVCSMGVLPFESLGTKSYSSSSSQVSELWSELSEEQSTATHASEMLEAETTERMRLEKEVQELQNRYSQVQQRSDKMELEMMEARVYRTSELNGDLSDDDDLEGNASLYKQKYERALKDMEIMKRRIQQQHEEEMEQKTMLKKASDKRLAEALEDVEEERQVANQWKRKAQKLGSELQDIRLMLEEQMARNGELEKKQRRFDAELSSAQEEIKKERLAREKLMREKDQALHEKYSLEQDLQSAKLDADMLHEKIAQLNRELDELTLSSKGEEEVTQLKRAKQELERKTRDQEEELEELAAQVQMLEQAKLRLEMSLEKVRQEHRREASVREEEIEEIRASFSKKVKNLEAQLEAEQDERHQLVKQKHELERHIYEMADQPPPQDPEIERRLRRDLKRTKALLRDAQTMLEHTREGQSSKTLIRQLKNQLEDSEFAKATAVKARQAVEAEMQECQTQLEEVTRAKNEAEGRCLQLSREKSAIQSQLEEAEEEMAEVMKKYKAVVAQMSIDQKTLAEQTQLIAELETEKQMLKDQLSEVSHKFEHLAGQSEDAHKVHRLDSKIRDLESKLELEQTTRARLEHQISRLKEQNDRSREECDALRNKELQAQEGMRRLQRQIRDLREDYSALQQKEADAYRKQHELEMALENSETDLQVTKNDLRLACQRIQELQNALEDEIDSGTDVPDDSGSDSDSNYELALMRNQSVTPVHRCDSAASNLSYISDGVRSRTSSFSQELSAFSSRNDAETDINGLSGVNGSNRLLDVERDETV